MSAQTVQLKTKTAQAPEADPTIAARRHKRLVWWLRIIVLVLIIIIWQLVVTLHLASPTAVAAPWDVVLTIFNWFQTGFIWQHLAATGIVFGGGFALGLVGGIVLGILAGAIPFIRYYLAPFVAFFNALPRLVLIPFFIVVMGFTDLPGVVVTALSVIFLVIVTVQSGMDEIGADYVLNSRALGARWGGQLTSVYLPGVAIWIFAAARSSVGMAFQAAVVSQYFGSPVGLGYLIAQGGYTLNAKEVFAGIVLTAILAFLVDLLVRILDRRFARPDLVQ